MHVRNVAPAIVTLAAWAAACDGTNGAGADGDCPARPTPCVPLDRRCSVGGTPQECSEDGRRWHDREPCPSGRTCDPAFGECLCGPGETDDRDGNCVRTGPPCDEGRVPDAEGRCPPAIASCGSGEIPVIGGTCAPVGPRDDCGAGAWGNIPVDADTVHVDASYAGGGSNGTAARPFTRIQDAVDSVPLWIADRRTVAVAAGRYPEAIALDHPVNLLGRCASMVTVAPPAAAVDGIRVTLPNVGIQGIALDRAGGREIGIRISEVPGVVVRNVVVRNVVGVGIRCADCIVEIADTTVEGIDAVDPSTTGIGIGGWGAGADPCRLTLSGVRVARAGNFGVFPHDCDLVMSRSMVEAPLGPGVLGESRRRPAGFVVRETLVGPVAGVGIGVRLAPDAATGPGSVIVERNIVRDVTVWRSTPQATFGISILGAMSAALRSNVVERSEGGGIRAAGAVGVSGNTIRSVRRQGVLVEPTPPALLPARATIQRNDIRDVGDTAGPDEPAGYAVHVRGGTATVERNRLSAWQLAGVHLDAPTAGESRVTENVIDGRGSPPPPMNHIRTGIPASAAPENAGIAVDRNVITGCALGVHVEGGRATIDRNRIGSMEPATLHSIVDNTLYVSGIEVYPWGSGANPPEATVEDNLVVVGSPWAHERLGISVGNPRWTVRGNRVVGGDPSGIDLFAGPGVVEAVAAGNTVVGGAGAGILAWAAGGTQMALEGNVVSGVAQSDLWPTVGRAGDGMLLRGADLEPGSFYVAWNRLLACNRAGLLVSGAAAVVEGNAVRFNGIGVAWQDRATVNLLDDNDISCNADNGPVVDAALPLPP